MRKIVLTAVGAALIAVSSAQIAAASERYHVRKEQAPASEQFRNSNNSIAWPTESPSAYTGVYSGGWSAPAGR
jgi:cysteine synthase